MMRTAFNVTVVLLLLLGLPVVGILLAGKPLALYLEFPPRTRYVDHEPFSWPVFVALAIFIVGFVSPFVARISSFVAREASLVSCRSRTTLHAPRFTSFPWWGWAGIGLTVMAWVFAWNRFDWFASLQPFTFTPLWLGYILVVNAWTFHRTGSCMMVDRPRYFLALFPLSSAFWWFFEYLNRFVQNWYYSGVNEFTPIEYFLQATIPFSTVLPAVLGTKDLLASCPGLTLGLERWHVWKVSDQKPAGWGLLIVSSVGLVGIGVWPNYLFPLVWIAPLLVITSLQMIADQETIFAPLARGDWRVIWQAAQAALVCGFFWELWNSKSLAHWEYAVPFVQRFHLFEMPLLSYAGYLPFGLECVVVAQAMLPNGEHSARGDSARTGSVS